MKKEKPKYKIMDRFKLDFTETIIQITDITTNIEGKIVLHFKSENKEEFKQLQSIFINFKFKTKL